jgi:hypothetical protein
MFIAISVVFFLSACIHLLDVKEKPVLYEENFTGEYPLLASCVIDKLQSDSRWALRMLQFTNLKFSDADASEIYAFDSRYLPNMVATYSPTNPDAVLINVVPTAVVMPYAQRNIPNNSVFALMLEQVNTTTIKATLKGDAYTGAMTWKILQTCITAAHH